MMGPSFNLPDKVLLGIAIACSVALTIELLWPHSLETRVIDRPAVPEEPPASKMPDRVPLKGAAAYAPIAKRPLFTLDRRPYQIPVDEPVREEPEAPRAPRIDFELSAIVTTGDRRIALLKASDSEALVKLALGQSHGPWTLTEVLSDAAVLSNGSQETTLQLQRERYANSKDQSRSENR